MIAGQQRQLGERAFGAGEHRLQAAKAPFEFVLRDPGLQQFGQAAHAGDFLKVEVRQPEDFLDRLDQADPLPMPDESDGDVQRLTEHRRGLQPMHVATSFFETQ